MDKTKTAVIIGILCLGGIVALIYANRDKFSSSETKVVTAPTTAPEQAV